MQSSREHTRRHIGFLHFRANLSKCCVRSSFARPPSTTTFGDDYVYSQKSHGFALHSRRLSGLFSAISAIYMDRVLLFAFLFRPTFPFCHGTHIYHLMHVSARAGGRDCDGQTFRLHIAYAILNIFGCSPAKNLFKNAHINRKLVYSMVQMA